MVFIKIDNVYTSEFWDLLKMGEDTTSDQFLYFFKTLTSLCDFWIFFCIYTLQLFFTYTHGLFKRSFWSNMNKFFLPLEVCLQIVKHLDVIKGRLFLIRKKSPLASKQRNLIILFKRGEFKQSRRCLSTTFLIYENSHCFSKTAEGDITIKF